MGFVYVDMFMTYYLHTVGWVPYICQNSTANSDKDPHWGKKLDPDWNRFGSETLLLGQVAELQTRVQNAALFRSPIMIQIRKTPTYRLQIQKKKRTAPKNGNTIVCKKCRYKLPKSFSTKVRIYKEYHSVCPLFGIGTLPTPLSPSSVPLPPEPGGGAHSPAGEGLGESQFRWLGKSLALCLLCGFSLGKKWSCIK
jgi:hypothetical protein